MYLSVSFVCKVVILYPFNGRKQTFSCVFNIKNPRLIAEKDNNNININNNKGYMLTEFFFFFFLGGGGGKECFTLENLFPCTKSPYGNPRQKVVRGKKSSANSHINFFLSHFWSISINSHLVVEGLAS